MTGDAVRPEEILKELHSLWTSLGGQVHGEHAAGVLRACAMTLIVVSEEADPRETIGETLAESMREHPCRAIVLRFRDTAESFLDAKVSAQCWLPLGQRRQICSEQIEIVASAASLPRIPALLLPLAAPDLPVVVWCRSERLFRLSGFQPVAALCDKLIVDSERFRDQGEALAGLRKAAAERSVADLAWARLTRWREMLAQVFQSPSCRESRDEIFGLRVHHSGRTIPAGAYYLAAWLGLALGWRNGESTVRFEAVPFADGGDLLRVSFTTANGTVSIEKQSERELITDVNGLIQWTVLPPLTEADVLGEELSIAGRDPVFERVLPAAERIARSRGHGS